MAVKSSPMASCSMSRGSLKSEHENELKEKMRRCVRLGTPVFYCLALIGYFIARSLVGRRGNLPAIDVGRDERLKPVAHIARSRIVLISTSVSWTGFPFILLDTMAFSINTGKSAYVSP